MEKERAFRLNWSGKKKKFWITFTLIYKGKTIIFRIGKLVLPLFHIRTPLTNMTVAKCLFPMIGTFIIQSFVTYPSLFCAHSPINLEHLRKKSVQTTRKQIWTSTSFTFSLFSFFVILSHTVAVRIHHLWKYVSCFLNFE